MFELFYDFMVDNEAQQGASANTLLGLMGSAANASLLLLNGDVSYARGQLTQWDVFMSQMQPLATRLPWMLVEGVRVHQGVVFVPASHVKALPWFVPFGEVGVTHASCVLSESRAGLALLWRQVLKCCHGLRCEQAHGIWLLSLHSCCDQQLAGPRITQHVRCCLQAGSVGCRSGSASSCPLGPSSGWTRSRSAALPNGSLSSRALCTSCTSPRKWTLPQAPRSLSASPFMLHGKLVPSACGAH